VRILNRALLALTVALSLLITYMCMGWADIYTEEPAECIEEVE